MKSWQSVLWGMFLSSATALAQTGIPSHPRAAASDPLLEALHTAPDPSSTIEAYVRGATGGGVGELGPKEAFVRRMFELGTPELADVQAHDLVNRGAADPIVRGVAAYNDAGRGNARAAIDILKAGLTDRPNDPFLLRTAGQVVAWYDSLRDRSSLSKDDVAGIEWLRSAGRQEFADAYRMAIAVRQRAAAEGAAQSAGAGESPAVTSPRTTAAPGTQPSTGEGSSVTRYESTQSTYYYPAPGDGYGNGYGYGSYYGYRLPNSIIALRDRDFQQLRFLDRQGPLQGRTGPLPGSADGRDGPAVARAGPPQAQPRPPQGPPRPMQAPARPMQPPPRPPAPPRPPGP